MVSLKSLFTAAVQKTSRFFDRIEETQIESRLEMAKAGFLVAGISGRHVHVAPLTPEEAKNTVAACEQRLAELRQPRPAK